MNKRHTPFANAFAVFAALGLLIGLSSGTAVARAAPLAQGAETIKVTVKAGESLNTYTRLFGVTGGALRAANPQIKDPNIIHPGDVINIPVAKSFTPSLTTPFYYVVQPGDQLFSLARRFEQYPDVIARVNNLQNDIVVLGSTLLIPAGPHIHYAVAGETLKSIGARYRVTVQFLLTGNNLPNPDLIYIGQPIFIPIIYNAAPLDLAGAAPPPPPPGATAAAGPTAVPTVIGADQFIKVTVRSGDSFLVYSRRFGVTGAALRRVNPQLRDPNIILPGEIIVIPVIATFTPSRTTPFYYVVQGGENAASIAAQFEMSADTLLAANPGASFAAGATILVPAGPHVYTVKQGDSLGIIAAKYGTTVDFLLTGNQLPNPSDIFPGQLIFVPTQYNHSPVPFS